MKTIEFHILQNFPPSNLNRDDSGVPKDCDFGGYRRQRISSQCLKRSVRLSDVFRDQMTGRLGIRTKRAPQEVADRLIKLGRSQEQAKAMAEEFYQALYKIDDGETKYLLYVGPEELHRATTLLHEANAETSILAGELATLRANPPAKGASKTDKEKYEKAITEAFKPFAVLAGQYKKMYPKHVRAVDVALFGRMLADSPTENIDAACQVSHAISVNRMNMEFDYFTAVDDIPADDDNAGAAMIGTIGFSSSCFYRFACVDMSQLSRNLGGDDKAAAEGVLAFAEAFVQARPSGKQNTFAAHSLPALVMIVVRESGQPVSLVNAFENPVKPTNTTSLTNQAIASLGTHYGKLQKMYGLNGQASCVILDEETEGQASLQKAGVTVLENVPALLASLKVATTNSVSA